MMEKMKERIVTFGDAVIAIIITIIVLELPIKLSASGQLELETLFRSIGIYFISFCFVGDLWYQGAQIFSKIQKIKNKDFVIYMLFLFFLSLIPSFTRLLIEDTNQQIVLVYGLLSFIVTILWDQLLYSFNKQIQKQNEEEKFLQKRQIRGRKGLLLFRLIVLFFAYFFPIAGLIVYLILPILGFLQNIIDREEDSYLEQMTDSQKDFYMKDTREFRKANLKKYLDLLKSSMNEDQGSTANPQWLANFNQQWQNDLSKQMKKVDEDIQQAKDEAEKAELTAKKESLEQELNEMNRVKTIVNARKSWKKNKK